MIKNFNYLIQSILIYFLFLIGRIFGLYLSRKIFSLLFCIFGPTFKSKKIINSNLNIFSSQMGNIQIEKIIQNMWKNYGMTFIEYIFLDKFRKDSSHIKIYGENYLSEIKKSNRPVIFVSGHFANFELMSMEITKKKISLATIYRPLNNFFLNPFMEYLRRKYICANQIKKGLEGVREAINHIKDNRSIALMIDQRVSEGERVDFFGKKALTTTLPAQLAIKYKLKIIPVFIQRVNNDKFILEFKKEINPNIYKNKFDLTEKLNRIIENMIIKNPNQWIWTHNRWK